MNRSNLVYQILDKSCSQIILTFEVIIKIKFKYCLQTLKSFLCKTRFVLYLKCCVYDSHLETRKHPHMSDECYLSVKSFYANHCLNNTQARNIYIWLEDNRSFLFQFNIVIHHHPFHRRFCCCLGLRIYYVYVLLMLKLLLLCVRV